jgi:hypothetical protein
MRTGGDTHREEAGIAQFDFRKLLNFDWRTRENYIAQLARLTVATETSEKWWPVMSVVIGGLPSDEDELFAHWVEVWCPYRHD